MPRGVASFVLLLCAGLWSGCGDPPAANNTAPANGTALSDQGAESDKLSPQDANALAANANGNVADAGKIADSGGNSTPESSGPLDDLPPAEPEPVEPPFDLTQAAERFLVLSPQGPLVVDLVISIDGAPYKSVMDHLIGKLLETPDGQPLTWDAALRDVRFLAIRANFAPLPDADADPQAMIETWDTNKNGTVELDEARAYLSRPAGDGMMNAPVDGGARVTFDESGTRTVLDRWWRAMDGDGDGRVTPEEAATVQDFLSRHDTDDDEVLALRDILPSQAARTAPRREAPPTLVLKLSDRTNWNAVAYEFEERYLYDGELCPESFPLTPDLFAQLDTDGNTSLGARELPKLLEIAPHLVLNANFGDSEFRTAGLQPVTTLSSVPPRELAGHPRNRAAFEIARSTMSFQTSDAGGADLIKRDAERIITQLDANQDGYLSPEEAQANPLSAADRFALLDTDGNEMLVADELLVPLTWSQAARLTDITITVRGQEHSAFAALDANADGRITAREIQSAQTRIASLDEDGDGVIRYGELPTTILLEIRRANGGRTVDSTDAVRWFAAMDTNDDGDISRREFLGSDDQFRQLDANDDGLIDQDEARKSGFE